MCVCTYTQQKDEPCVGKRDDSTFPEAVFPRDFERIGGKRVEGSNGSIIDDYALSAAEKRVVGVQANSRMGAHICRDRYFEFFSLEMAIVVANVSSLRDSLHASADAYTGAMMPRGLFVAHL